MPKKGAEPYATVLSQILQCSKTNSDKELIKVLSPFSILYLLCSLQKFQWSNIAMFTRGRHKMMRLPTTDAKIKTAGIDVTFSVIIHDLVSVSETPIVSAIA
jgi:hypothetical protein